MRIPPTTCFSRWAGKNLGENTRPAAASFGFEMERQGNILAPARSASSAMNSLLYGSTFQCRSHQTVSGQRETVSPLSRLDTHLLNYTPTLASLRPSGPWPIHISDSSVVYASSSCVARRNYSGSLNQALPLNPCARGEGMRDAISCYGGGG